MRQNSQKLWTKSAVGLLLGLLLVSAAAAEVKLPGVFGDHMVLQRDGRCRCGAGPIRARK